MVTQVYARENTFSAADEKRWEKSLGCKVNVEEFFEVLGDDSPDTEFMVKKVQDGRVTLFNLVHQDTIVLPIAAWAEDVTIWVAG